MIGRSAETSSDIHISKSGGADWDVNLEGLTQAKYTLQCWT